MNKKGNIPFKKKVISGKARQIGVLCLSLWVGILSAAPHAPLKKKPSLAAIQRKVDYFFYEGVKLKNEGKYDAAYEMFYHCLQTDSTAAAPLYELSAFYLQLNQPEKAAIFLRKAVAYAPSNFHYKLALASLSLNIGMYGEAAEIYRELVKTHPGKVELNYYLAEALTQAGEIGEAIDRFNDLENAVGMNEALSTQKYKLYMQIEEPEKAFGELKKLADKYPSDARYPILIGDLYLQRNDTVKAYEYYQKAHGIDPSNPYYTVSMANYYEQVGDHEAAEKQIHTALINKDLDVSTKMGILARYIGQLQQSRNGTEAANALFQTLLEQHPEDTELKLHYGSLLAMQGKTDEAQFQYRLVTEMEPDNESAWQQLLNLAFRAENIDEAIRICRKCQELFPEAPGYYFYLGIAYYQQNDYRKALETYREGLAKIPEDNRPLRSDFYGQIGDIYYQMKQVEDAFNAYEQALKYNDKNVPVLNNYSYFLTLRKHDLDKAERMSAQCIKLEPNNPTYLDTYAWVFFMKGNYTLAHIYIRSALEKDTTNSAELVDHYGDILYMTGDKEKALEQWKKAQELGKDTEILKRKIAEGIYIEDPNEE